MKKFFLALVAVATIAFVGCSKDDDDNSGSSLAGTSWTVTASAPLETITETLQFKSGGVVVWSGQYKASGYETETYSDTGSYTYEAPVVTIRIVKDDKYGADVYTGKVEGKRLTLYDSDGDVYLEPFTKN